MRRLLTPVRPAGKATLAVISLAILGLAAGGAYVAVAASKPKKPEITSGPADPTGQTSASFAYTSKYSTSFLCSLDGGAFAVCGSGGSGTTSYAGLDSGRHAFRVEAQTGSQTSDPDTWTWTIDTTPPPAPSITRHPADPTDNTDAHFRYTDGERHVQYLCSLDSGGFRQCGDDKHYAQLGLGGHVFRVEAVDEAGNTSAATEFAWTVLPPAPPKPKITSGPDDPTNQTGASFTYKDKSSVSFLCSLDGSAFAACGTGVSGAQAYAGPLADGPHTFLVAATQGGSAASRADSWTWTVDTVPPPPPTFKRTPSNPTTETKAKFEYRDAERDVTFQCRLDGGPYAGCGKKRSYDHLTQGSHTFCVRALDKAGNVSAPACFTWQFGAGLVDFTISGSPLTGVLLYPGGPSVPVNLVFTNPNGTPITVQSAAVTVTGTSAGGCDAGDFSVTKQLSATPIVPASSTKSLQDLGVPQSDWPQLQMADNGNQDGCQNAAVNLGYTGTATG
jgi:large repetitive protein